MFWRLFLKAKWVTSALFSSVWLRILFALGLVLYALLNIYFYKDYGLSVVAWHTHLAFPVYLAIFLLLLVYALQKVGLPINFSSWKDNILYVCWLLWCFETLILLTGIAKVSNEDGSGHYMHHSHSKRKSFYHVWPAAAQHLLSRTEFTFSRNTNSLGFADYEWIKEKPEGTIRILCFGDSFTEGDGAHADSSYVAFLRSEITTRYKNVEVMNAGTCGSDPFFNFVNLKDRLVQYKPDIIVQLYSSNDMFNDFVLRGGLERFDHPPLLNYAAGPWWEPIYALSYACRFIVRTLGYNHDLTRYRGTSEEMDAAVQKHAKFFVHTYQSYATEHAASLLLFSLPMREDVAAAKYYHDQEALQDQLKAAGIQSFDLLPCYLEEIQGQKRSSREFYWVQDAHHNADGYKMMANCISKMLMPTLEDRLLMRDNLQQEPLN